MQAELNGVLTSSARMRSRRGRRVRWQSGHRNLGSGAGNGSSTRSSDSARSSLAAVMHAAAEEKTLYHHNQHHVSRGTVS